MNVKKTLGAVGIFVCILAFLLVIFRVISWEIFWLAMILVGGLAYLVIPAMSSE